MSHRDTDDKHSHKIQVTMIFYSLTYHSGKHNLQKVTAQKILTIEILILNTKRHGYGKHLGDFPRDADGPAYTVVTNEQCFHGPAPEMSEGKYIHV